MEDTRLGQVSGSPMQTEQGTAVRFIPYNTMYTGVPVNTAVTVVGESIPQSPGTATYSIVPVSQPPDTPTYGIVSVPQAHAEPTYAIVSTTQAPATPTYSIVSGLSMLPDYAELPPRCNSNASSTSSVSTQLEYNQDDTTEPRLLFSDSTCDTNWNILPGQYQPYTEHTERKPFWSIASVLNAGTESPQPTTEPVKPKKRGSNAENYKRYPKPPYTYTAMLIMAIENSTEKRLTLTGIHNSLKGFFEFFNGEYVGWKDSIRHNLSNSVCFYKDARISLKENQSARQSVLWCVDLSKVPADTFNCQSNRIAREGKFKKELHEQLSLPRVVLPSATLGDIYVARNSRHSVVKTEPPATYVDTLRRDQSEVGTFKIEAGAVSSLWKQHELRTLKVEERPAAKDCDAVRMTLPMKYTAHANVATDSPEHLRLSDLPHNKRSHSTLIDVDDTPTKVDNFQKVTSFGQSPVFANLTPLMPREMNDLFTFVTSTEHTSSPDTAVNNLSMLCSPAKTSKTDDQLQTETHVPSPRCETPRINSPANHDQMPRVESPASLYKPPNEIKTPIVEYIVHNGCYTIHRQDDTTAAPYDPYAPLPKRPRTESSQEPTFLEYKSPLDFFADSAIAFGQK